MRIELHRHGGFAALPGKDVRRDVDTGTLAPEVSERVADAVTRADPDRLAATGPSTQQIPAAGDRRIYDLTLTDESGRRELRFVDPRPPELRDLVALLLSLEDGT
jgi:hypothetical protein